MSGGNLPVQGSTLNEIVYFWEIGNNMPMEIKTRRTAPVEPRIK